MATFRDVVLPAMDNLRAVAGVFGIRTLAVTAKRRVWSGERVGLGSFVELTTTLTNKLPDGTLVNAHVKQVSRSEAIASGGILTNRDLKVGPVTPPYPVGLPTGGYDDGTIDPAPVESAVEVFWNVSGSTMPAGGAWFNKISEENDGALHYYVFLRANGRRP